MNNQINAKVETVHVGQRHRYGDSFYEFRVFTKENLDRETVIQLTDNRRISHKWQSKEEWKNNYSNADAYFSGYCDIQPQKYGYFVQYCEPYTD